MNFKVFEKALMPYERMLISQEKFRKRLGVKEVSRPTYERYITGNIERYDSQKNAFAAMAPDNPHGKDFREQYKAKTGVGFFATPLPQSELEPEDRVGQALSNACWRGCLEYSPVNLETTPAEGRVEFDDSRWLSRFIKKVTLFLGAEMVRITRIDQRWVYSDIEIPHKYAIIAVVSHNDEFNQTAPSHLSGVAVGSVYSRLKFITTQLSDFIRGLGYDAEYRETLGMSPEMLMVPMAIDAGVGEFARNGRVLSPEFGINMRLKAVTTDLPLEVDKPISFKVHEFCMTCESCATYCPVRAIPFGEPTEAPDSIFNNPGYKKWYIKADKCLMYWMARRKKWTTCGGRCIAVCPWNKPQNLFHNTVRRLAVHSPSTIKKLLVKADEAVYKRKAK
jgi:epoxyqueuosine reductase